jgi:hypothetical protein
MSSFTPQIPSKAFGTSPPQAVAPLYTAVSASDILINDGLSYIFVKNAGGSSDIVSVVPTGQCDQGVLYTASTVVAAGTSAVMGPFPISRFGTSPTITHTFITSVTLAFITILKQ